MVQSLASGAIPAIAWQVAVISPHGLFPVVQICCSCPETKAARDACTIQYGPEAKECQDLIEAHKKCLREEGFNVRLRLHSPVCAALHCVFWAPLPCPPAGCAPAWQLLIFHGTLTYYWLPEVHSRWKPLPDPGPAHAGLSDKCRHPCGPFDRCQPSDGRGAHGSHESLGAQQAAEGQAGPVC
jgi:hypothetical protein